MNAMGKENDQKNITDLVDGQTGIIVSIAGGKMAAKRLADLGLAPGTAIKVLRKTLFSGPVQIEICGSKLAIGRGLASKIFVELK
jgi:Fe2+ transport system protein FeoA